MKQIWKYKIKSIRFTELQMPIGAEILTIQTQTQFNDPILWALVDPSEPFEERTFELIGTGIPIDDDKDLSDRKYIGTYQSNGFVGHIFEYTKYQY